LRESDYRARSFWHESVPGSLAPRPALAGEQTVDVAIVGAGYTGLWTAWYLTQLEPSLRIAIVEGEIAGFGASGRNGGWCLGNLAGMEAVYDEPAQREGGIALQRAMFDTVDEVGRVCQAEGIDCHWRKGGTVSFASVEAHRRLLLEELEHLRGLGFGEEDYRWLEPEACRALVRSQGNLGGLFSPHCAALHPARLARGLAEAVERRDVVIYEGTPARALERGCVVTANGRLRAETVVRATEAYTKTIRGQGRALAPLHSLMFATEPLPETVWKEIGLPGRETFADPRRMVIYGQRTADDRLAFGARGAYYFGSRIVDRFPADAAAHRVVQEIAESLFPVLRGQRITHRWGGALAVPRNWRPTVSFDRQRGLATAGGYVGEGVAATNLAGRTLADLITGRDSERVRLPLVGDPPPAWEPEPLRWLGISGVRQLGEGLDEAELAGRSKPRLRGAIFDYFVKK
jgi:glycine/D-amino acid oxidase-like deaminating enzyme